MSLACIVASICQSGSRAAHTLAMSSFPRRNRSSPDATGRNLRPSPCGRPGSRPRGDGFPTPSTSTLSRPRCEPPLRKGERRNAEMLVYTGERYSGRGLNPHVHDGTTDFESAASAIPPPEHGAGREDRTHLSQLVELVPSPEDESRVNLQRRPWGRLPEQVGRGGIEPLLHPLIMRAPADQPT